MEQKKLLVLGSDNGTLDLAREALAMGLYVIVADNMKTSPTKEIANERWLVSTTDLDELERRCKENKIGGVVYRCDFNANYGRQLCRRLGLPYYNESDEAWLTANNKAVFKKHCLEVGAPISPGYKLTDELLDEDLDKIQFPVVCKPVDKSGNRGMSYCYNKEQLIEAWKYARSISDNPDIVVERMLTGPEFAVNYVLADGEPELLFFSSEHNQPGELDNLYSIILTTSHHLKQFKEEVNPKVKEVFKAIGCKEGVAWVETILDNDGHFYLLEMGYRFGGEMINVPYERISGFNSLRWMIEIALGIKHTKEDLPKEVEGGEKGIACSYFMFSTADSVVGSVTGIDKISELPNVIVDIQKREGKTVYYHAIAGAVRIHAKDIDELIETLKVINQNLTMTDVNGKDLFVKFTDYETLRKEYEAGLREFEIK